MKIMLNWKLGFLIQRVESKQEYFRENSELYRLKFVNHLIKVSKEVKKMSATKKHKTVAKIKLKYFGKLIKCTDLIEIYVSVN